MKKLNKSRIEELKNKNISNVIEAKEGDRVEAEDLRKVFYVDRSEFMKDRDRILYSNAFRRLQHKTQVYSNKEGDHYRTRLTHTIQVAQISRTIAKNLGLNEDLTEAIALGHDLGHTPFGHVGEKVLNDIMKGDDLSGRIRNDFKDFKPEFGGFKHNFFSVKILDNLDQTFENIGLNLNWQVLEGILKHTDTGENDYDSKRFFINDKTLEKLEKSIELNKKHSVTLEGQIVAISDEIAQRHHDLDDGLRMNELEINDFKNIIKNIIGKIENGRYSHEKDFHETLCDIEYKLNDEIDEEKKKTEIKHFLAKLIDYFIKDVVYNTFLELDDSEIVNGEIKKKIVSFSPIGKETCEIIEKEITTKILNSYNVNRFDGKSRFIIRELFRAYYANPRQIPEKDLKLLLKLIKNNENIFEFKIKDKKFVTDDLNSISDIDFSKTNKKLVDYLIKLLKLEFEEEDLTKIFEFDEKVEKILCEENSIKELIKKFEEVMNSSSKDEENVLKSFKRRISSKYDLRENKESCIRCLLENHHAYLSIICDYIAQMTDDFANKEFKALYLGD